MSKISLSRIFSFFMIIILAFSTLAPSAFAQTPISDELKAKTGNILNLEVIDSTTNETHSTSLLFEPGSKWDESILKELDEKYIITKNEYRELSDTDIIPSLVVSNDEIQLMFVDTIFDVGNFTISLAEFIISPSIWTGLNVVMDGLAVVFPGIPSVNGVKRMIGASSTLKTALKYDIKKYGQLQKVSIPSGWERHHIFEKRFAKSLGTTSYSMLAIALPKTYHTKITSKMAKKIPTGQDYTKISRTVIINKHIEAYKELYNETKDPVWEFLYEFSKTKQHTARE